MIPPLIHHVPCLTSKTKSTGSAAKSSPAPARSADSPRRWRESTRPSWPGRCATSRSNPNSSASSIAFHRYIRPRRHRPPSVAEYLQYSRCPVFPRSRRRRQARRRPHGPQIHRRRRSRSGRQTIARLRRNHLAFTIDLLGEAVISESEAQQYQRRYLGLVSRASRGLPLPLIDRHDRPHSPRQCFHQALLPLQPVRSPRSQRHRRRRSQSPASNPSPRAEHGVFVNLDMEQFAFKDLTHPNIQIGSSRG